MSSGWRESGGLWISLYFLANLILTIHNKWVLSKLNFSFPWILTAVHLSVSGVGSWWLLERVIKPSTGKAEPLPWNAQGKLWLFSILYAVNIAMSNVSLNHVSLSLHQVIRSATPAITALMEWLWFSKQPSLWITISLLPVSQMTCFVGNGGHCYDVGGGDGGGRDAV